jgi:dephospho-CoA kinase
MNPFSTSSTVSPASRGRADAWCFLVDTVDAVIVGVVGGIGAGKSTVVQMLADCGAETVDADREAHEVLEEPEVRRSLREHFGEEVFLADGRVDRGQLARRVFSHPEELRSLEALVHPRVRQRILATIEGFEERQGEDDVAAGGRLLALDVPLLLESPLARECDAMIYVDADSATRARRVADRGWSPQELARRERFQKSTEEKKRLARFVIDNSGTLEETRRQVEACYAQLFEPGPGNHGRDRDKGEER